MPTPDPAALPAEALRDLRHSDPDDYYAAVYRARAAVPIADAFPEIVEALETIANLPAADYVTQGLSLPASIARRALARLPRVKEGV